MFNLSEWLKGAMIDGVVKGQVGLAYAAIKSEEYLGRGVFTEADVREVAEKAVEPVAPEAVPEAGQVEDGDV
jgi:hypothetical protein